MAEPLFVRECTAVEARRLRRQADAYDELLLRRLEERGEPPADTALYHAATERVARARAMVLRERLVWGMLSLLATGVIVGRRR